MFLKNPYLKNISHDLQNLIAFVQKCSMEYKIKLLLTSYNFSQSLSNNENYIEKIIYNLKSTFYFFCINKLKFNKITYKNLGNRKNQHLNYDNIL